jgi:hypothetical protein
LIFRWKTVHPTDVPTSVAFNRLARRSGDKSVGGAKVKVERTGCDARDIDDNGGHKRQRIIRPVGNSDSKVRYEKDLLNQLDYDRNKGRKLTH